MFENSCFLDSYSVLFANDYKMSQEFSDLMIVQSIIQLLYENKRFNDEMIKWLFDWNDNWFYVYPGKQKQWIILFEFIEVRWNNWLIHRQWFCLNS